MALQEFRKALDRTDEIEITVTGRKSGRKITLPVWFVREGDRLFLLPVKGSDSDWFKNVLKTPEIRIVAGAVEWDGRAVPIRDAEKVRAIADKFREKYGSDEVARYYTKFDAAVEVPLK